MNNRKTKLLAIFIVITAAGAGFSRQEQFSSPLAARSFYEAGYELYTGEQTSLAARQAMVLFNAAIALDNRADYVPPEIINLAWQFPEEDFSDAVKFALSSYMMMGRTSDLEIASKAVKYLLEKLGTREEREQLLQDLLEKYRQTNPFFASELATQLALLKTETADKAAAQGLLMYAYTANNYNILAFNMLADLAEGNGEQIPDIVYLRGMRSAVRVNPLDLKNAFDFSRSAESLGLYAPAAAGYLYCIQVYKCLNPKGDMPAQFYRPLILNGLNMRDYRLCRDVLSQVRAYGVFDVMVEAIAAAAANQSGEIERGMGVFDNIKARGDKIRKDQVKALPGEIEDLAWFYCFVDDANNTQDMLAWATKAYDADNNSVSAAAFLAYALIRNGQIELAKPVIEKIGTGTQTAAIAKAEILIANNENSAAIDMLKSAVASSPGTFEAKKAKALLKQLESEYVPPVDAGAIETALVNDYGENFFSEFVPPENMVTVSLKTSGNAFSYGSPIDVQLAIINNYTEPMIVCPEGIFKGNIRVDVRLSGDITDRIDNYIVKTIRPSYEIRPGQAVFVPIQFVTGKLKSILENHPQADLNMEITVYVDPQNGPNGQVQSLFGAKPVKVVVKRRKLELDIRYLQQRFDAMKNGKQGQKIKSAQLFAGLLAEQQKLSKMAKRYKFVYSDPGLLKSALAKCLQEDDWVLKMETMAQLQKVNLDYQFIEVISEQLDYNDWPVRLMSLLILADKQGDGFLPVLKWVSKNDNNQLVKQMAIELAGGQIDSEKKAEDMNSPQAFPASDEPNQTEKPAAEK